MEEGARKWHSECVWCEASTSKLIRMCMVWSQYIKADQNVYGVEPVHQSWSECVWCRASTSKLIRMCMVWSQYIKADQNVYGVEPVHQSWSECVWCRASTSKLITVQREITPVSVHFWHKSGTTLLLDFHPPYHTYLPPQLLLRECFFISFSFLSSSSHQSLVSYCAVCQTGIIYHVVYLKKGTFLWCLTFRLQ